MIENDLFYKIKFMLEILNINSKIYITNILIIKKIIVWQKVPYALFPKSN